MYRVFLCGAHSTGKTTLLNRFLLEFDQNFSPVHEIARRIIAKNRWSTKDFDPKINPEIFYQLQVKILQEQSRKDNELMNQNKSYISDRGLDPIIYCKMYLGEHWLQKIMETTEFEECIERHKALNTLTIILKPHEECLEEDNTRLEPKMDELMKFTELLEEFLKEYDIKFETIAELDLDERVSSLKSLVMKKLPK